MKKVIITTLALCLVIGAFLYLNAREAEGEEKWIQTTDADFYNGAATNVEVMGRGENAFLQLTRENELGVWHQQHLSPSKREDHAMVYNAKSDKMVLFGGRDGSNLKDDTWAYDTQSDTWTQMNPSVKPAARYGHAMAYDSWNDVVVLFGGYDDSNAMSDTWLYYLELDKWVNADPDTKPSARY